jgi:hypothetical protein
LTGVSRTGVRTFSPERIRFGRSCRLAGFVTRGGTVTLDRLEVGVVTVRRHLWFLGRVQRFVVLAQSATVRANSDSIVYSFPHVPLCWVQRCLAS